MVEPSTPPHITPRRIQRRRTKGWRMPKGAKYVGRPSRWGNPYAVHRVDCTDGFGGMCWSIHSPKGLVVEHIDHAFEAHRRAADFFRADLEHGRLDYGLGTMRSYLRGHDLACWCPEAYPCHAAVLLELANS